MIDILQILGLVNQSRPQQASNMTPMSGGILNTASSLAPGEEIVDMPSLATPPINPTPAPQERAGVLNQTQQPGILERMGFATDNFGGRLANALMSAGSPDPAATLARLQASDLNNRQVKRTPMGNGAFVLEEYPDGSSKVVPNKDVADYNTRQQANKQKPPTGYRYTPEGDLEVIPGGPVDKKDQKAKDAEDAKIKMAEGTADATIVAIDRALGAVQSGAIGDTGLNTSSGILGKVLGNVPQTSAYNLKEAVKTVKANVGFQQLQAMREASPTGGALGQVAVQELNFLQAALASLDEGQSPEILRDNLTAVRKHFTNWKNTVAQARQQNTSGANAAPGGAPGGAPAAPQAPRGNDAASRAQGYLD
jgi:hypothetical protein